MYLLNHDDNQDHRRRCRIPFPSHVSCFLMISLQTCPFFYVIFTFLVLSPLNYHMDRVKRIWYLSPMRAAKVQASLRIRAVSPEPSLLAHTSSESRGTFRQKARSLAPLNGRACAVEICHDGMLEDTNSLDGAQMILKCGQTVRLLFTSSPRYTDHLALHLHLGTFCGRHEMCCGKRSEIFVKGSA